MNSIKATKLVLLSVATLYGVSVHAQEPVKADPYKSEPIKSEPTAKTGLEAPTPAQSTSQLDKGTQSLKFDQLDINRDGFITKEEVPATLELSTSFVNFDDNADGKLSKDEYGKYKPMKDESKAKIQKN
jgi:hypothetical protein